MGPRRRTPAPATEEPGPVQEANDGGKNSIALQSMPEDLSADGEEQQEDRQRQSTPDTEDASGSGSEEEERSEEEGTTDEDRRKRLRGDWRFAALLHFCRLFSNTFQWGLYGGSASRARDKSSLSADQLESALLDPRSNTSLVGDLVYRLAHRCEQYNTTFQERRRTTALTEQAVQEKWEAAIIKWAHQHWHRDMHTRNPLHKGRSFLDVSPSTRLAILFACAVWQLDVSEALTEAIRATVEDASLRADVLRLEPLGVDAKGNRFFHLSESHEDCWLFREDPPKVKGKGGRVVDDQDPGAQAGWHTECTTLEELKAFATKMSGSRSLAEKELGTRLEEELLPPLAAAVEAQRRAEERALLYELAPKKRSGRVAQILQKKEEEERQRLQEKEERAREKARLKEERAEKARQAAAEKRKATITGAAYLAPPTKRQQGLSRDERLALRAGRRATSAAPSSGPEEEDNVPIHGGDGGGAGGGAENDSMGGGGQGRGSKAEEGTAQESGPGGAQQAAGREPHPHHQQQQQQQQDPEGQQQGQHVQQEQSPAGQLATAQGHPDAEAQQGAAAGAGHTQPPIGHAQAQAAAAGQVTQPHQMQDPVQAGGMQAMGSTHVHLYQQQQKQPQFHTQGQQYHQIQPALHHPQQQQHSAAVGVQGQVAHSGSGPDSQRLLHLLRQGAVNASQGSAAGQGPVQGQPQQHQHQMVAPAGFQHQMPVYVQQQGYQQQPQMQHHPHQQQFMQPQMQGVYYMQPDMPQQHPAQQPQQQQHYMMQMHPAPQQQQQQHQHQQAVYMAPAWNGSMQGTPQYHVMQMPQ